MPCLGEALSTRLELGAEGQSLEAPLHPTPSLGPAGQGSQVTCFTAFLPLSSLIPASTRLPCLARLSSQHKPWPLESPPVLNCPEVR